jgi:hypothetical protein
MPTGNRSAFKESRRVTCFMRVGLLRCMSPVLAQTRSAGMSAIPPLLGDKRTSRGEPISVAIDPERKSRLPVAAYSNEGVPRFWVGRD